MSRIDELEDRLLTMHNEYYENIVDLRTIDAHDFRVLFYNATQTLLKLRNNAIEETEELLARLELTLNECQTYYDRIVQNEAFIDTINNVDIESISVSASDQVVKSPFTTNFHYRIDKSISPYIDTETNEPVDGVFLIGFDHIKPMSEDQYKSIHESQRGFYVDHNPDLIHLITPISKEEFDKEMEDELDESDE